MIVPIWTTKKEWNRYIKLHPIYLKAFERDKYKCVDCGTDSRDLIVHSINHIPEYLKKDNNLDNLIVVCRTCHAKRYSNNKINNRMKILERIKDYTKDNTLTDGILTVIGEELGITRERVRQILKQSGYVMPRDRNNKFQKSICRNCREEFDVRDRGSVTRTCCTSKCYKEYRFKRYWTSKKCKECKKPIVYRKALRRLGMIPTFCSKRCQGYWLAKHYGFKKKHLLAFH